MQSILTKSYDASGAIADHTIVKITADNTVAAGAAATDDLVGVSDAPGGVATTERVDVIHAGVADVLYGGVVAVGDFLTSDASGKAVAAAPAAGTNNSVIGRALIAGVANDIGKVLVNPGQIQG